MTSALWLPDSVERPQREGEEREGAGLVRGAEPDRHGVDKRGHPERDLRAVCRGEPDRAGQRVGVSVCVMCGVWCVCLHAFVLVCVCGVRSVVGGWVGGGWQEGTCAPVMTAIATMPVLTIGGRPGSAVREYASREVVESRVLTASRR